MAKRVDDINLPSAAVMRIAKEALPEYVSIGKDAKPALTRAASLFALYITSTSNALAKKSNRKTITANDVIDAINETDFDLYTDLLKENLQYFRKMQQEKKDTAMKQKLENDGESSSVATKDDADEIDTD